MPKKSSVPKSPRGKDACCDGDCACGGCGCGATVAGCCEVGAVVGVDARGQMVLPKSIRQQMGIHANDRLAVVVWKKGETACCLALMKVDELAESVRKTYGPLIDEIVRG